MGFSRQEYSIFCNNLNGKIIWKGYIYTLLTNDPDTLEGNGKVLSSHLVMGPSVGLRFRPQGPIATLGSKNPRDISLQSCKVEP